jgi:hypothetical protein
MGTNYIAPIWRMPENTNKSKSSNYSIYNGSYDHILTTSPYSFIQGTGVFTFSAFFKLSSYSGFTNTGPLSALNIMASTAFGSSQYGFAMFYDNRQAAGQKQNLQFNFYVGGNSTSISANKEDPVYINDNNWHHVVVTGDGTNLRMYLDNALLQVNRTSSTEVAINSLNSTASTRNLGFIGISSGANSYPFKGQLGQFLLYDYTLTADKITRIYNNENPFAIGTPPQGYYDLGSNSNPTTTAGYPNISVGADSVFDFEGPNLNEQFITTTYFPNGESNFTYSTWVNCNFYQRGALLAAYGGSTHQNFSISFWTGTGGVMYVFVGVGVYAQFANFTFHGYPINEWTNISILYDGTFTDADTATQNAGRLKLYINGNYEAFDSFVGTIPSTIPSGNTGFYLGALTPTTYEYGGKMSNVQMWNTTLLPANVTTLYNYGSPLSGTQPQATNLKGWWKLNQSANWEADTAGEWQIPDNRSSFPTSFNISGSTQMTVMNQNLKGTLNQIAGSFSASIWFKTSSTSSLTIMARTRGGGPTRDLGWSFAKDYFYNNGAYLLFSAYNTNGDNILVRNTTSPYLDPQGNPLIVTNDNKWHHGLCVYDKDTSNVKIYVDGILQNSVTQSGFGDYPLPVYGNIDANAGGSRTTIGGINNGSAMSSLAGSFNGELSNAQVWNKSLSSSNAISLYNTGIPLTTNAVESSNLICWNKLDIDDTFTTNAENKGNFAIFNQTASTGVSSSYLNFVNDGVSSRNPGVYGGFNYFGFRTANYSSPTTYHQLTSDHLSFSCWFKFNGPYTSGNKERTLVSFSDSYYQTITYYDNGAFRIYGNNASRFVGSDHTPFTNGEWHNLIIYIPNATSNNEGGMKLFLDGEEVFLSTSYSGFQYDRKQSVIGSFNYSGGGLPPRAVAYADWVIYDTDVTSSVSTIYNNGVPNGVSSLNPFLYYKFDSSNCNFITDGNNSRMEFTDVSGNNRGAFGPWNNLSGNNSPRLKTENIRGGSVSLQGNTNITLTEQNLVNNNVSTLNGESSGMDTTNLVTSNLTKKQPFSSYSVYFDGAGDTFDIPDATVLKPQNITVSTWLNGGTQAGNYRYPLAKYYAGSGAAYGFYTGATTNKIAFTMRKGNDTGWATTGLSTVMDDTWHHIVGTFDGTTVSLYVDGALTSAVASGSTGITYGSGDLTIGAFQASSLEYVGDQSNVAIWDSALNTDDILNLYNNGVTQDLSNFRIQPVAWYPMDESYTYFNGSVLVARDVISGNDGVGANITQEKIIGNAPGSTGNGIGTNLTIADLKGNMSSSSNNSYSINMADYASGVTNPANSGRSTSVPG